MSAYKLALNLTRTSALGIILAAMSVAAAVSDSKAANLSVAAGTATVGGTPTNLTFNQTSLKAVYNSTDLNFGAGGSLTGTTPGPLAVSLILVSGGPTTWSSGANIASNGRLWVINPAGFSISNAHGTTSGLLLSTSGIADPTGSGFMTNAGSSYVFDQAGNPTAKISIDNGAFTATGNPAQGGDIILMAPQVTVTNDSSLFSNGGNIQILSGSTFTADFGGDGLINFAVIGDPVSAKVPGSTSSIEVSNTSTIHAGKVTIGAKIFQDAVLDHVINLGGQYETGTYNKVTNPQHVVITTAPNVYETIVPNPPVATTGTLTVASNADAVTDTSSLTRSTQSLGNETAGDTPVNPRVTNDSYEKPYSVSLQTSVAEGALTLLSPSAGGSSGNGQAPISFGNLSPSAGGNTAAAASELSDLSPAAGGARSASCANNFLDNGWSASAKECAN